MPVGDERVAATPPDRLAGIANRLGCLSIAAVLLVIGGRPLATDDTWWHLSLGRRFLVEGPWLGSSPTLHTSASPPAPSAWLSDILLYCFSLPVGVGGLRIVHAALIATIALCGWHAFRRATKDSVGMSSTGCALFLVFAGFRLTQLRPELGSLLASLVLYLVLLGRTGVPEWRRVAWATVLCGVWANIHPGFLLGPVLVATACLGTIFERMLRADSDRIALGARATRLFWATVLTTGASLVNPLGGGAHLLYFIAGEAAPAMHLVADEWAPLDPFRFPPLEMPPTPLLWILYWGVASATGISLLRESWRWRSQGGGELQTSDADGASMALALLGCLAPLLAVRFLWMSLFPLLFLARHFAGAATRRAPRRVGWGLAFVTWSLIPASFQVGDWPLSSIGLSRSGYLDSYDRWKYHDHALDFLRESGVTGRLYNHYSMGGFLGYWLAPELQGFIDGSLNVSPEVMDDYLAILAKGAGDEDIDITALLDRYGVDLFIGVGLPHPRSPHRPWRYTAGHLAGDADWLLAFRDLRTAIYLRNNERNQENLRAIAAYYADEDVPFDIDAGLSIERVSAQRAGWAITHGLLPRDFDRMLRNESVGRFRARPASRLASTYLALGLDERAIEIDERLIQANPTSSAPRRRRIAALLRLDRLEEAAKAADELELLRPDDMLARRLIAAARTFPTLDPDERRRQRSVLPVLSRGEARQLRESIVAPVGPARWPARREDD